MTNQLMGPPLPKTASINRSLAPPDPEDQFVLTPQKIEKVLSKYTPLKMESPPQRMVISKPILPDPIPVDENHRPPWNNDVQIMKKQSPVTPFARNVFREVNQLRGTRDTKSFGSRLKEMQENATEVSEVGELSDHMQKLSTGVKGKDDKIKILEENLAQAKKELNQFKLAANARQVEWVETLRTETEFRQRLEVEMTHLRAKMELEKQNFIKESANVTHLKNELSHALSLMDDEQREKFKSRIPQS